MMPVIPYEIEVNEQRILLCLSGFTTHNMKLISSLPSQTAVKQISIAQAMIKLAETLIEDNPEQSTQFCDEAQEVSYIDSSGIAVLEYLWRMSEQRQGIEDYFRHSSAYADHLPGIFLSIPGYFPICKNCLPVRMMTECQISIDRLIIRHDDRKRLSKGDLALS